MRLRRSRLVSSRLFSRRDRLVTGPRPLPPPISPPGGGRRGRRGEGTAHTRAHHHEKGGGGIEVREEEGYYVSSAFPPPLSCLYRREGEEWEAGWGTRPRKAQTANEVD